MSVMKTATFRRAFSSGARGRRARVARRRPPNKEHQQMMADIRMLQEQTQQLQNLLGAR